MIKYLFPWRYVGSEGSKDFYEHRRTGVRKFTQPQTGSINPLGSNGYWARWLGGVNE